jgi:hypothetical protein
MMAKTHNEERHSRSKQRRTSKDLQEIKEVLSYTAGGYIIRATLRAEVAKGLPLPTPRFPSTMLLSRKGL